MSRRTEVSSLQVLLPAVCLLTGGCAQKQPAWFEIPMVEREHSAAESFRREMAGWEVKNSPGRLTFLIAEIPSGAPWRCVLIRPASSDRENGLPIAWKVQYPVVPVRAIPSDSPMAFSQPPVLGATDTRLYLRADGRTYAVPLDSLLKEEPPDFPLG